MIRRFSHVVLQPGLQREIGLLERPDDRPALLIATSRREGSGSRRQRRSIRLASFRVFAAELEPLLAALDAARNPDLAQAVTCGETRLPSGVSLVVGASPSAVRLQFRAPEGRLLGQPTVIDGDELAALELAAHHLTSLPTTNFPPTGERPMNEDKKALELEAKQLERSIAEATAAGQTLRAEKLEARRQRVLARVSA